MYRIMLMSLMIITFFANISFSYSPNIIVNYQNTITNKQKIVVEKIIDKTENFFIKELNIKLENPVNIYVVSDRKQYKEKLVMLKVSEKEIVRLVDMSSGAAFGNDIIIVTDNSDYEYKNIQFLIAHELTHQYQFQIKSKHEAIKNMWLLEGAANYVGYFLSTGIPRVKDQKIDKDEITGYQQWRFAGEKYGYTKVYDQCLYEFIRLINKEQKFVI